MTKGFLSVSHDYSLPNWLPAVMTALTQGLPIRERNKPVYLYARMYEIRALDGAM